MSGYIRFYQYLGKEWVFLAQVEVEMKTSPPTENEVGEIVEHFTKQIYESERFKLVDEMGKFGVSTRTSLGPIRVEFSPIQG